MNNLYDHDLLTGLDNRWRCQLALQQVIDAGGDRVYCAIDIDGFRSVNEQYGTQLGDQVLRSVAQTLRLTYPDAFISRVSGDEFAFILAPTTYSRTAMSQMTRRLFQNLNAIRVEGAADLRLSFSIGSVYIDPQLHHSADEVILDARRNRFIAKRHEGNFLNSHYGFIPDIEGAFRILRDDRTLYNSINNRLFNIRNEADWLAYLGETASLKENMYKRNQSQLDDLLLYFQADDLPAYDYELLFSMIEAYFPSLDAYMCDMLLAGILIPYYERQDLSDPMVVRRLGRQYLMMVDSLLAMVRMGDRTQLVRIRQMLEQCFRVTRHWPHDSLEFQPYFYALCHMVGHYESLSLQLGSLDDCDRCYEELRQLLLGPDPVVFTDADMQRTFDSLVQNARFYPLYRAAFLMLRHRQATPQETAELRRRTDHIRAHLVDGIYDMVSREPEYRHLALYIQPLLLEPCTPDEVLQSLIRGLRTVYRIQYGQQAGSNLIIVAYLFLAASKALQHSHRTLYQQRIITLVGLDILFDLLRRRENIANDHQLLFLTQMLMRILTGSTLITPVDKVLYLERAMAIIMLDTYGHSRAVAAYAKVILANIIDHSPHLLVGPDLPYDDVRDVRANRQMLLDFMDCACLLHDIGKLCLTPITGNAYRRLTDAEFSLIRQHPLVGRRYLQAEPAFAAFLPFTYEHHRWWNGRSGYPAVGPDDEPSRMRFLVDILTLCDSLEAATSRIGRNYRRAKTFLQIMDEFYVEAGTRYSRDVLQTIIGSPETYYTLRQMVDLSWQQVYQTIFYDVVASRRGQHHRLSTAQLPDPYRYTMAGSLPSQPTQQPDVPQLLGYYGTLLSAYNLVICSDVELSQYSVLHNTLPTELPHHDCRTTSQLIDHILQQRVSHESHDAFVAFFDTQSLQSRLQSRQRLTLEYDAGDWGWQYGRMLPAATDAQGRVTHFIFATECVDDEHQYIYHLSQAAAIDGLTGLLNRQKGEEQIRAEVAKGGMQIFAVLDCDNFKSLNDNFSHLLGDRVLRDQGHILGEYFAGYKVMRLGGDEFVAYINGEPAQRIINSFGGVRTLFLDLAHRLSTVRLPELEKIAPTMSVGVVYTDGSEPVTFDQLYQRADEALRESKRQRNGTITIREMRRLASFFL